ICDLVGLYVYIFLTHFLVLSFFYHFYTFSLFFFIPLSFIYFFLFFFFFFLFLIFYFFFFFFFQAEDGIRDKLVTGVQTCALPILHVALDVGLERHVGVHGDRRARQRDRQRLHLLLAPVDGDERSEERRVGKECRCRWGPEQ